MAVAALGIGAVVIALLFSTVRAGSGGASPKGGGEANKNAYFNSFQPIFPGTPLGPEEMRISFFGTTCIPMLSQAAVSVLVELGNGDHVMFDAGTGVTPKYWAMGHGMNEMDKVFLAHLHADHMGELPFIYGFGPFYGRGWPLYVWGPGRSDLTYRDPNGQARGPFEDGTSDAMRALAAFDLWHSESQSFAPTGYADYVVPAWCTWCDGTKTDSYDIVATDLDWRKTGYVDADGHSVPGPAAGATPTGDNVAFEHDGAKVTHFPAVHTRAGSVSYKLEWNGLSMIYAGDTLPNNYMLAQASGVDVLVHEIVMPASVWNQKLGVPPSQDAWAQQVQDSSHTPQKAYGYLLSQLPSKPRLAVGTHFQATDDTIQSALDDIRKWYAVGDVVIASDFMVITVSKTGIDVRRGVVSEHAWPRHSQPLYAAPNAPKYWEWIDPADHTKGVTGDPTGQLDPAQAAEVIPPEAYNAR
jgi:ribonuclease Z